MPFHLKNWKWVRLAILMSFDALIVSVCYYLAYLLRLDDIRAAGYLVTLLYNLPLVVVIHLGVFLVSGMYRQVWRFANFNSAMMIARNVLIAAGLSAGISFILSRNFLAPRSVPIIYALLATVMFGVTRFSWRAWNVFRAGTGTGDKELCLIYGAGVGGDLLIRHIQANPRFPYAVIGFVDDDKNKWNRLIHGFRILGGGANLGKIRAETGATTVIFAMPGAPGRVIRRLIGYCHGAELKPLIMPDLTSSLGSDFVAPRAIDIADLLRRSPKSVDRHLIEECFEGRAVLVTGAGGSIGSEICRQVMQARPKRLILFESSEYNLYRIELELQEKFPGTAVLFAVLGSVTDERAVRRAFEVHRPEIVIHAAAYKHVPLIEANPVEGVLNNIKGTKVVAETSVAFGVKRFVQISTDKAVRPTGVMGATKRCCEILIQAIHASIGKECAFCMVRFGNVLGSSGSVIPRFMEQIQRGGPITVTHPEVTRYFMLTSEAVGLVLHSAAISKGDEIFVLNMSDPVKINEMAMQLVYLTGKEPGRDIEIVYTGLRPGEKLYEELTLEDSEHMLIHDDIFVLKPRLPDPASNLVKIDTLIAAAERNDEDACRKLLRELANQTFAPPQVIESSSSGSATTRMLPTRIH